MYTRKITLSGEERMFDLHASEIAQTFRQVVDTPAPGSIEESEALAAIDRERFEHENPASLKALRRRQRRHWSDREHALGR